MSQMAILLRRSSACLIGSGSQFFYRYLSAAANPSHTIIPTSVSSARRFSSSSPLNSNEPTVGDNIHQPSTDQQTISEIFAEIQSVRKEIKSIREKREGKKEPPIEEVVVVKEKHPLLKNIELEMSKSEELKRESEKLLQLPHGFEVESDKPGAASVTLKGTHENEIINIELSIPAYYVMLLTVKVTFSGCFSGFFNSTEAVFHCTFTSNGFEIEKIKNGTDHGILFYNLPKNLKDEFHKYLETRGLNKNNLSILYRYMVGKTNRENLRGLENFRKMVEAA